MKSIISIGVIIVFVFSVAFGGQTDFYQSRTGFLFAPSSVYNDGLLGYDNPALPSFLNSSEIRFIWNTDQSDYASVNDWGLAAAVPHIGFGLFHYDYESLSATSYNIALSGGTKAFAYGIGYNWSSGDDSFKPEKYLSLGSIIRPGKEISFGFVFRKSTETKNNEFSADLGVRPFGAEKLTLFTDGSLLYGMPFEDINWSMGGVFQITEGLNITGRYFDSEAFTIGLSINLGHFGFGSQTQYNSGGKHASYSNYLRLGGLKTSFLSGLFENNRRYLSLMLKGRMGYHRYKYFDKGGPRLFDVLSSIKAAASDERVGAIAVNLSGLSIMPEHAWEIRRELEIVKSSGKPIIIFIDKCGLTQYHLASVADLVVMDPMGYMILPGFSSSRTYLKGTFEKMGLGFDEWRFFEYKSGAERYSRDSMSDADREQRQAYVDDRYELVRNDICSARSLTHPEFDGLIDTVGYFDADDALLHGLVDTLARWSDVGKIVRQYNNRYMFGIGPDNLKANALTSTEWGALPEIAIVYGLGDCAMDSGIKARWLEKIFLSLSNDPRVKAVVFRVDSPGGYGLPSDMVAQAVKKCAANKPVIVSQGQVAASGGYWISVYGDEIIAGPNTITASIGTYGGWVYDKELTGKLGLSHDYVKRGAYADLGLGVRLPLLGITVPARNLTDDEYALMKRAIMRHYDKFVNIVADGRSMPVDSIRQIAEGRIYSGIDGRDLGLVDRIGTLFTAIVIAKEKAGITPDQNIKLVEIPKYKGLFDFDFGLPEMPDIPGLKDDPAIKYLKMLTDTPGQPLFILHPELVPEKE